MFELSVVTKKLGKFDFRRNSEGKNKKRSDENAGISVKTGIFFVFPVKSAFSAEMR